MGILKVGMVQQSCCTDIGTNIRRLEDHIRQCAAAGAGLVVLQELHNSTYFCQTENASLCDLAEPVPGPSTDRFGALAKELGIVLVLSLFERRTAGIYHNTAVILEKDGKRQEFTLDNYPDSTWTFVESKTVLKEKGYEPPIHDFAMLELATGTDITEQVLADSSYTFLMVAHRIEEADDSHIDLINEIYDYSVEHGYRFYALTSSATEDIEEWCDRTGAEYPFCQMDDITLKAIVRSNPGMLLVKGGVILNKWSDNQLPDEYVLTDALENLPLGQQKDVSDARTLCYVLLWFVIPLLLVLWLDILVVKRRMKKPAGKQEAATRETNETH